MMCIRVGFWLGFSILACACEPQVPTPGTDRTPPTVTVFLVLPPGGASEARLLTADTALDTVESEDHTFAVFAYDSGGVKDVRLVIAKPTGSSETHTASAKPNVPTDTLLLVRPQGSTDPSFFRLSPTRGTYTLAATSQDLSGNATTVKVTLNVKQKSQLPPPPQWVQKSGLVTFITSSDPNRISVWPYYGVIPAIPDAELLSVRNGTTNYTFVFVNGFNTSISQPKCGSVTPLFTLAPGQSNSNFSLRSLAGGKAFSACVSTLGTHQNSIDLEYTYRVRQP